MEQTKRKPLKPFSVMLTITNQCNLNCSYCYEKNKDMKEMSLELAKQIVAQSFSAVEKSEDTVLEFDFHGGEPFMNYPLMKDLCEWTWERKWPVRYRFFITTNGTLITKERREWLAKHKDKISACLSLDGAPDMNLKNRGTCIEEEVLDFFIATWPLQPVKMTVSKETVSTFADGVIYAHDRGFNVSVNMACGIDWDDSFLSVYESQLDKLVDYYAARPDITPCSLFSSTLSAVFHKKENIRHCGMGKSMTAYDTAGNSYPCHLFLQNSLKAERWEELTRVDFKNSDAVFQDEDCKACPIYKICPTCYGMNFLERNAVGKRDKRLCRYIKLEKKALAGYKSALIRGKKIEDITETDYLELKAIQELSLFLG